MATPDDAPAIAAIYAPIVKDTIISFEETPPSAAEMAERIGSVLRTHPWLVAEDDGSVVGYAYGSKHRERAAYRWACDVSVYVAEPARRKGAGKALYTKLLSILRAQGFQRAYAGIALPNPGSVALHRAVGFAEIGTYEKVGYKFGRWHDVLWMGLALDDSENPREPTGP